MPQGLNRMRRSGHMRASGELKVHRHPLCACLVLAPVSQRVDLRALGGLGSTRRAGWSRRRVPCKSQGGTAGNGSLALVAA